MKIHVFDIRVAPCRRCKDATKQELRGVEVGPFYSEAWYCTECIYTNRGTGEQPEDQHHFARLLGTGEVSAFVRIRRRIHRLKLGDE